MTGTGVNVFLAISTYFGYVFVIAMYTVKAVKYLRRPRHLRWDLYPVMHEEKVPRDGGLRFRGDRRGGRVRKNTGCAAPSSF